MGSLALGENVEHFSEVAQLGATRTLVLGYWKVYPNDFGTRGVAVLDLEGDQPTILHGIEEDAEFVYSPIIRIANLDGDGQPDLVYTMIGGDSPLRGIVGPIVEGPSQMSEADFSLSIAWPEAGTSRFATGDVDGDGIDEVVTASEDGVVVLRVGMSG